MADYMTRRGSRRKRNRVDNYDALLDLPYRLRPDDGKFLDLGTDPWPTEVPCLDCGCKAVGWAEGGFVPGHRICPMCGSHWELTTVGDTWRVCRAKFYEA